VEDNKLVEYTSQDSLILGKGYLLIVRKPVDSIATGAGSTLPHREAKPFLLPLKPGWNLIGNPYNFNLSWKDIKEASGIDSTDPSISDLRVFQGGEYVESDRLDKLRGGFIYSDKEDTLKFPVLLNPIYNTGSGGVPEAVKEPYASSQMEVNFILQSGEYTYSMAGLGMHPQAKKGRDRFDKLSLPQILQFLQLNFAHPEDPAQKFTKDMVPVEEQYIWEFTVEARKDQQTGNSTRDAILQWETFAPTTDQQLILYDVSEGRVIHLRDTVNKKYKFRLVNQKTFQVYYGSKEWLQQTLKPEKERFLPNVPNPFTKQTTLSFTLPDRGTPYHIELGVYDLTGRKVASLVSGSFEAGVHETVWHAQHQSGVELASGMYLARLQVDGSRHYSVKLIVQ
jgi:hypothetical protein